VGKDTVVISRNVSQEPFEGKVKMAVRPLDIYPPSPFLHPINICLCRYHIAREFSEFGNFTKRLSAF
jgi:hypothetical protein